MSMDLNQIDAFAGVSVVEEQTKVDIKLPELTSALLEQALLLGNEFANAKGLLLFPEDMTSFFSILDGKPEVVIHLKPTESGKSLPAGQFGPIAEMQFKMLNVFDQNPLPTGEIVKCNFIADGTGLVIDKSTLSVLNYRYIAINLARSTSFKRQLMIIPELTRRIVLGAGTQVIKVTGTKKEFDVAETLPEAVEMLDKLIRTGK